MRAWTACLCVLLAGCAANETFTTAPPSDLGRRGEFFGPPQITIGQNRGTLKKTGHESVVFSGGNGLSVEQAVVISGASNYQAACDAEIQWTEQRYQGFGLEGQVQVWKGERGYDVLQLISPSGESVRVFFDVSNYLRK